MITLVFISIGVSALAIILLYVGSYLTATGKLGPVAHDAPSELFAISLIMLIPVWNVVMFLTCAWALIKNSKWLDKQAFERN